MNLKPTLLTLAFALSAVFAAFAQQKTVNAFPPQNPNAAAVTAQKGVKAALNQDKKKGLKVFGATNIDYNRIRHFVNYYENEYELERLQWISREDENIVSQVPDIHMIHAGAYNMDDGYYYAYKVQFYTIGITYACQWLKVNPATGEWTVVKDLDTTEGHHIYDANPLYDMAYSVYDGEMFGLVKNTDGQIKSRIGIINMDDFTISDFVQLDDYYFGIAFDYDGNLYAIRWDYDSQGILTGTRLDEFDADFKVKKSTKILVDGAEFKSYFQHGLDFDYTTGDLIWSATNNEAYQKMVRINPDTYETTNMGSVGFNEVMVALHVPYRVAQHREAPAKATDLNFRVDRDGNNSVTVTWTNPATMWNRKPLTNLASVKVYRDNMNGEPIATLDAAGQEGKAMSYTDAGATSGVHTYYVVPVNAKGDGVSEWVEAYVGRDVPGVVTSLKVEGIDNGLGIKISWGMPANGGNEGWFDRNLTYDVERLPDHKMVAQGITATSFEDKNIEEAQFYTYVVTAINSDGRGTPLESEGLLAGASLKVPFATHFETENEANRFSSVDTYGYEGRYFTYDVTDKKERCMSYLYNDNNNVILVSPPLNLTKGKKYRVDWEFSLHRYGYHFDQYTNHFRIFGGQSVKDMKTVIADYPEFLSEKSSQDFTVSDYFESPVDGNYCVGFGILTPDDYNDGWIYMTGFSVVESPDDDLAVTDFYTPEYVSSTSDNHFDVTVYNNGGNAQSKYTVEVGVVRLDGKYVPFASTTDVPAIDSHKSAVVRVTGKANYSGVQDLVARVILEGDGNADNDQSEMKEVTFFDGSAYNHHADEEYSRWTSGTLPFNFYNSYAGTQTIYTAQMLGFEGGKNTVTGLAWEYRAEHDINDFNLKVYLNTTEKNVYDANAVALIQSNNKLVFDGTVNMKEGEHWLIVDFPEKAFEVMKGENLVVTVAMEESSNNGTFPVQTYVFNSADAALAGSDGLYHTLHYNGNVPFEFGISGARAYKEIPVIHVASLSDETGIDQVTGTTAGNLGMAFCGNALRLSGKAETLSVYDLSGSLVSRIALNGKSSVNLPLAPGVYVVKATAADGTATVAKLLKK